MRAIQQAMQDKDKKFILAVDQSTSATKVMLFDYKANLADRITLPHKQHYPAPDFAEHDPEEIFENTRKGLTEIISKNRMNTIDIAAVSITNQRETAMIWDKTTGKPVSNAIVWQCQRGKPFCDKLRQDGYGPYILEKTGLIIDPYFSASKLHWIMNNVKGVKEKATKGNLLLGTMDSWLLWKLTAGKIHATDFSNACRTMLFNINTLTWDEGLASLFHLIPGMLPEIRFSDQVFGYTDPSVVFDRPLPVAGLLGDSHAALFGQNCFESGMAKASYGTGSSIMMNIGDKFLLPPEGLVTSVGWGRSGTVVYVFEGNIHCTGDTISWLVNDAELIKTAGESEILANSVPDNNQVYFVPSFVGLGAPYWNNEARACISGMSRSTKKAHIVRAALESIAYQVKDLIDIMIANSRIPFRELRVDGGATRNNFLMQFQADMIRKEVVRSNIEEISALGAAYMAGLAVGLWESIDELNTLRKPDMVFLPHMPDHERDMYYKGWKNAVGRSMLT